MIGVQVEALLELMAGGEERRPLLLCEYAHSMNNSTGKRLAWAYASASAWEGVDWGTVKHCQALPSIALSSTAPGVGEQVQRTGLMQSML